MILDTESISNNFVLIQGYLQGRKVNFKVKLWKYAFQQIQITASIIPLFAVFLTEQSICCTILMI